MIRQLDNGERYDDVAKRILPNSSPMIPKRRRLSIDERNARTSARQVRAFLSGRYKSEFAYLHEKKDSAFPSDSTWSRYSIRTWTGDVLLPRVAVTKTRAPAFWSGWATRYYFTGKDARGRTWHGCSPGPGMFARLHLNKGRKPRPRPPSRAAFVRAIVGLLDAIEPPRGSGAPSLPLAGNLNPFSVPAFTNAAKLVNSLRRR